MINIVILLSAATEGQPCVIMYSVQKAAYPNQSHALPERYFSIIWFQARTVLKKKNTTGHKCLNNFSNHAERASWHKASITASTTGARCMKWYVCRIFLFYTHIILRRLMMKWWLLKLARKSQLLRGCGSDTSKWSLILISLPKGHGLDRAG